MSVLKVSGLTFYVNSLSATQTFYERLGFVVSKEDKTHTTMACNGFWIDFVLASSEHKPKFQKEALTKEKGLGMYIYLLTEHIDDWYDQCIKKGFTPSSKPHTWPWGRREFALRDPDGYKLIFYETSA